MDKINKQGRIFMKKAQRSLTLKDRAGKIGWIILWLIGIPIPVLLVLYLIRGCT